MSKQVLLFALFCSSILQASARCRFVVQADRYTCVLENVHVVSSDDMVDLSGVHIGGRTNADVNQVTSESAANSLFEEIPSLIFYTFANLEDVTISFNSLRRIQLNNCGPRMRSATLSGNSIPVVQNGAFRGCPTITFLHMVGNGINLIEENVFADLPNLREVLLLSIFMEVINHFR